MQVLWAAPWCSPPSRSHLQSRRSSVPWTEWSTCAEIVSATMPCIQCLPPPLHLHFQIDQRKQILTLSCLAAPPSPPPHQARSLRPAQGWLSTHADGHLDPADHRVRARRGRPRRKGEDVPCKWVQVVGVVQVQVGHAGEAAVVKFELKLEALYYKWFCLRRPNKTNCTSMLMLEGKYEGNSEYITVYSMTFVPPG